MDEMEMQADPQPITGRRTGWVLGDVSPLAEPWRRDAFGMERPPLSAGLLRLSLEMCASTYGLDTDPWLLSGWQDAAVEMDDRLYTALDDPQQPKGERTLPALRQRLWHAGPIDQTTGTLRYLRQTDSGKALVMAHPLPDGRHVISISFMGTSGLVYDWFANFRMAAQDGMHQGFLEVAEQFAGREEALILPKTAKALGLERLTLRDVLQECTREDSRFLIWLTGHSQGAAVMQIWAYRKLTREGVLARHLLGVGFAAPAAAKPGAVACPAALPLWLLNNSDDLVPHLGGIVHLGALLLYPAGPALRSACYDWPADEASVRARTAARRGLSLFRDTPESIIAGSALLRVITAAAPADILPALAVLSPGWQQLRGLLGSRDAVLQLERYLERRAAAAYASITGQELREEDILRQMAVWQEITAQIGLRPMMQTMAQMAKAAHALSDQEGRCSAYQYIVMRGTDTLVEAQWTGGLQPRLHRAGRTMAVTGGRQEAPRFREHRTPPRGRNPRHPARGRRGR